MELEFVLPWDGPELDVCYGDSCKVGMSVDGKYSCMLIDNGGDVESHIVLIVKMAR